MSKQQKKKSSVQKVSKQVQISKVSSQSFSGPIPAPIVLEQYNTILPGSAERILAMAENQSQHRLDIEKQVIQHNIDKDKRGQQYGLTIGLAGIVSALVCILSGNPVAGTYLGGISITGLATVFVIGKIMARKELDKKQ